MAISEVSLFKIAGYKCSNLASYLNSSWDLAFWFPHNTYKSIECFADVDFCGNWDKDFTYIDPETAKSWSGWFVAYAGYPIW